MTDRQLWRYVAAADALCKEYFDAKAGHLLSRHLLQRRQLYAHALGAGDYGTALRTLESEAKLENLHERELRAEIDELRRRLEELQRRQGIGPDAEEAHRQFFVQLGEALGEWPEARARVAAMVEEQVKKNEANQHERDIAKGSEAAAG